MNLILHSNKIDDYLKHDDVIGYLSKQCHLCFNI